MDILKTTRPNFLLLTLVCVALGVATALESGLQDRVLELVLGCVGAVAAHIAVNVLNEYMDFRHGVDQAAQRTPFSGGSGYLPAHPEAARRVLVLGLVALAITAGIGLFFLFWVGRSLLPFVLLGILVVAGYTPWITRKVWLSLIAPGLGFGPLMVGGLSTALTLEYQADALAASLVPFFLVNNLLLLNQFPDCEADKRAGRNNLPIRYGTRAAAWVLVTQYALAFVALGVAVIASVLPPMALLGFLAVPGAVWTGVKALQWHDRIDLLMPALGVNVIVNLTTPLLMAIGIAVARG